MAHAYGWNAPRGDHRDIVFNLTNAVKTSSEVPAKAGIPAGAQPPIWNQLDIGSCTAHGSLRAFLVEAIRQGLSLPMLSRLFQYWNSRQLEGTTSTDSGATVRDAIKALARFGVCPESDWPYDTSMFAATPPGRAYEDAKLHMTFRYKTIVPGGRGAPMRTAVSGGYAIAFGFSVPRYFEGGAWDPASGAPLPLPGPTDGFIGGHCVAATAYDFSCPFTSGPAGSFRTPPFFTCANSWDASWGMGGFFNMHADWFDRGRGLANDLWVIEGVA